MAEPSPLDLEPSPGAFEPLQAERRVQVLSRPSLSYWQDSWIRLKANRRALVSLYIVIALLAFTVLGPLVWTVDPAAQDLDQVSQPPGADRGARIVAPFRPWVPEVTSSQGRGLELAEPGTTHAVRLRWDPMPGAEAYRVYRHIFAPLGDGGRGEAPGLPLAETLAPDGTWFEDRMDLRARTYHYTVVGLDRYGEELDVRERIEVPVVRVITLEDAYDRGLATAPAGAAGSGPADAGLAIGDEVRLALHPLGTDYLGRDMLSRLMHGARVSLFIGIFAPLLYIGFGVAYGSLSGFLGGRTDQLLMRFAEFVIALPFLLFMILFKIVFGIGPGESGIVPMLVAMVLLSWPSSARLVRGQILQIRQEAYVSASRLLGAKTHYLVLRHMIPNTMGVILVTLTFAIPSAIFTEAFLSFIGMGVAPPTPSWGSMCNEGLKTMLTQPHELIFPALFISVTVLAFNLLGDGLRDALDAKLRSRE